MLPPHNYSLPRRLAAEFLGSFVWVAAAILAVCADHTLRAAGAAGTGWLGIALAQGLVLAAVTASLAHVSGAVSNPAATLGLWATRRLETVDAAFYFAAQLAGGAAAAWSAAAALPDAVWRGARLGAPQLAAELTQGPAMLVEGAAAFLVVLAYCAAAREDLARRAWAVGAAAAAAVLVAGPLSGAALTPARALGPAVAANVWSDHGVFWVGPLAGGLAAAWVYAKLFAPKSPPPA
jgi:glycerol uptake facilitator-like aquaporin